LEQDRRNSPIFLPQDTSREDKDSESNTQKRSKRGEDKGSGASSAIGRVGTGSSISGSGSGVGAAGTHARATAGSRRWWDAAAGERRVEERRSVGDTVGRSGDFGLVRNGTDHTQRLRGLRVGLDLAVCIGVYAGEVLVVALATLECTVLGVVRGVVGASDTVVDMLAEVCSVGTSGVTNLEAENVTTHEIVPFDDLLVVAVSVRPTSRVYETTEGVATEVSAMGVQLSSSIIGHEVDEGLVDETNDLEVVRSPHKLNTLEGASGDETSTVTGLGAPGDFQRFRVGYGFAGGGRCPKTEIINRVYDGSLTVRLLVFRRRVTPVVTELGTANTIVWVSLVWKVVEVEMLGSQGNEC